MPGILPMKVIRLGSGAQSRIAQACDRCRSKKIRCDGIRPQCTPCANVGFQCKTSDKLSRRAFPRGYTESLEDRVRGLEAEVRELKDLLDEKDKKIDMLSRIHSFSPPSRKRSEPLSTVVSKQVKTTPSTMKDGSVQTDTARLARPSSPPNSPPCTSSLIGALASRLNESGSQYPEIKAEAFSLYGNAVRPSLPPLEPDIDIPPRLLSDHFMNIFFQEWAPLLPVLHRPTFLRLYDHYLSDPYVGKWHDDERARAQLFLVFDIAALSSFSRSKGRTVSYEPQWRRIIYSMSSTVCISTLQCHLLAQLYYLLKADYTHATHSRSLAINICHQLGLHHNQKHHVSDYLELETRKKVLWCQYVLDKFISAASGFPPLLRDADISTEYPADVDDESVVKHSSLTVLPEESTKMSSALALFKICRILSRALDCLVPTFPPHRILIDTMHSISDELEQWTQVLPTHLRMKFDNYIPSTGVISDRSPVLSLAYLFIRSIIHRPLVCHGPSNVAAASLVIIADSAKHMVHVLELLEERHMNYIFPVNKTELLLSGGFYLLWQCFELSSETKLAKDNQQTLTVLASLLMHDTPEIAMEFQRVVRGVLQDDSSTVCQSQSPRQGASTAAPDRHSIPASRPESESARRQLQAIASHFSSLTKPLLPRCEDPSKRATMPAMGSPYMYPGHTSSQLSFSSTHSLSVFSMDFHSDAHTLRGFSSSGPNLDYLPLGPQPSAAQNNAPGREVVATPRIDWSPNFYGLSNPNISLYGRPFDGSLQDQISQSRLQLDVAALNNEQDWSGRAWPIGTTDKSAQELITPNLLCTSDGSKTSGNESFSDRRSNSRSTWAGQLDHGETGDESFKGIAMPTLDRDAIDTDELVSASCMQNIVEPCQ